jgi:DNA-binding response OmpR family regulator
MKNILIVEDESLVALEISNFVTTLGHNVCGTVAYATRAWDIVDAYKVDLILMDVSIKGDIDGIACAAKIKEKQNIPIIYISAFSDEETLARAIDTYPVNYLVKPFKIKELEIAIKIAFNSSTNIPTKEQKIGDCILDESFSYDSESRDLLQSGEIIHLTKQERELLNLLISRKNQIVSIYEIENELWPNKPCNENTRRALVARLRNKLNYKFLETIHSIGYRIIM